MHFLNESNRLHIKALIPDLLCWYQKNARVLPWRKDPTPYHVWISEIMLQQTRVEAVKEYYSRFILRYPDVKTLADTDEDELAKYWEGLGYYTRMRNLLRCAKILNEQYDGILPDEYEKLLTLPGIGSYTAGAVSSIAYGKPYAAVDGNVLRVLSRILAFDAPIDEPKTKNDCFSLLNSVMPKEAGIFNQSLMELGATVCLPNGAPLCESCPVRIYCMAQEKNIQLDLPVKKPKKKRRIEDITFLIIKTSQGFLLHKRPLSGLLASLWEYPNFPGVLTKEQVSDELIKRGAAIQEIRKLADKKHIFTHIEWNITAYAVICRGISPKQNEVLAFEDEIVRNYALPSAFDQYDRTLL